MKLDEGFIEHTDGKQYVSQEDHDRIVDHVISSLELAHQNRVGQMAQDIKDLKDLILQMLNKRSENE